MSYRNPGFRARSNVYAYEPSYIPNSYAANNYTQRTQGNTDWGIGYSTGNFYQPRGVTGYLSGRWNNNGNTNSVNTNSPIYRLTELAMTPVNLLGKGLNALAGGISQNGDNGGRNSGNQAAQIPIPDNNPYSANPHPGFFGGGQQEAYEQSQRNRFFSLEPFNISSTSVPKDALFHQSNANTALMNAFKSTKILHEKAVEQWVNSYETGTQIAVNQDIQSQEDLLYAIIAKEMIVVSQDDPATHLNATNPNVVAFANKFINQHPHAIDESNKYFTPSQANLDKLKHAIEAAAGHKEPKTHIDNLRNLWRNNNNDAALSAALDNFMVEQELLRNKAYQTLHNSLSREGKQLHSEIARTEFKTPAAQAVQTAMLTNPELWEGGKGVVTDTNRDVRAGIFIKNGQPTLVFMNGKDTHEMPIKPEHRAEIFDLIGDISIKDRKSDMPFAHSESGERIVAVLRKIGTSDAKILAGEMGAYLDLDAAKKQEIVEAKEAAQETIITTTKKIESLEKQIAERAKSPIGGKVRGIVDSFIGETPEEQLAKAKEELKEAETQLAKFEPKPEADKTAVAGRPINADPKSIAFANQVTSAIPEGKATPEEIETIRNNSIELSEKILATNDHSEKQSIIKDALDTMRAEAKEVKDENGNVVKKDNTFIVNMMIYGVVRPAAVKNGILTEQEAEKYVVSNDTNQQPNSFDPRNHFDLPNGLPSAGEVRTV